MLRSDAELNCNGVVARGLQRNFCPLDWESCRNRVKEEPEMSMFDDSYPSEQPPEQLTPLQRYEREKTLRWLEQCWQQDYLPVREMTDGQTTDRQFGDSPTIQNTGQNAGTANSHFTEISHSRATEPFKQRSPLRTCLEFLWLFY